MADPSRGAILVLGDDMRIFLAVTRSLGRAGYRVHAAPFNWHAPALRSRYVTRSHRLPRYSDNPTEWLASIMTVVADNDIALIIPCDDRAILPLDRHRDAFGTCVLAIPDAEAIAVLFDKAETKTLARSLDIPVTPWCTLEPAISAETLVERFSLPLVIKPKRSYSIDRLTTWGRVHICETLEHVRETLDLIEEPARYLVEQYIDGVGVGVSVLARHGTIVQAFQHRRLREGWGGSSSHRISEALDPGLLGAAEKLCRAMNIHGVCMFEFRRSVTDKSWILLEVNARFWGSLPLAVGIGLDFPRALCGLLLEQTVAPARTYRAGIRSRNATLDGLNLIRSIRNGRTGGFRSGLMAVADYLAMPMWWITGREHSDSFTLDDPKPGFAEIADLFVRTFRSAPAERNRRPGDREPGIAKTVRIKT
jgi:predicted ATP-grasp superfamily ATP-dependent carboligase